MVCSTNFNEMMGELFLPLDMPEPPKEGFFKGLFGGGVRSLDREELCKELKIVIGVRKEKNKMESLRIYLNLQIAIVIKLQFK